MVGSGDNLISEEFKQRYNRGGAEGAEERQKIFIAFRHRAYILLHLLLL